LLGSLLCKPFVKISFSANLLNKLFHFEKESELSKSMSASFNKKPVFSVQDIITKA
jgi:hypothetical protein